MALLPQMNNPPAAVSVAESPSSPYHKYGLLILLLGLSLALRLHRLGESPELINADGLDTLLRYLQIRQQHANFLFTLNWNGAPAFNTWLIGAPWEFFGQDAFALRISPAVLGSLSVAALFLLLVGFTKDLLLSFSISIAYGSNPWVLNFSREAWENIFSAPFVCAVVWGISKHLRCPHERKGLLLAFFGAVVGFYCYHPGKSLIFTLLGMLFLGAMLRRDVKALGRIAIISCAALLLCWPVISAIQSNATMAFGRIQSVSIFASPDPWDEVYRNLTRCFRAFVLLAQNPFNYERYAPSSFPAMNQFYLPAYLLGLVVLLIRLPEVLLTILAIIGPVILLSQNAPDAARTIQDAPLLYLVAGIGCSALLNKLRAHHIAFASAVRFVIILGGIIISVRDGNGYFAWIDSTPSISSRHPGVYIDEFYEWKVAQLADLAKGGGFNVGMWEYRQRDVRINRVD